MNNRFLRDADSLPLTLGEKVQKEKEKVFSVHFLPEQKTRDGTSYLISFHERNGKMQVFVRLPPTEPAL